MNQVEPNENDNNVNENTGPTGLEIAVIGMAGHFPGAKDIAQFWDNLKKGVESIRFFSDDELMKAGVEDQMLEDPAYVKARGVLDDIEYFEPAFFNFAPAEAEITDPQLRIFLECCWEALENAGYNPDTYDGAIGVYAGNGVNHHWIGKIMLNEKFRLFGQFKANLLNTHFSTRVSYHLNLKGPALTIQTACSTSLVTVHSACLALLSSECDMALAGGSSLLLPQAACYLYQESMITSPDGHCRPFDDRAKGTVGGSGSGVVLLKRLDEALEDRDYIYAVIKGTAINNDGRRKMGYTAPSAAGQSEVLRAAYRMAEVDPGSVGYIEAHGTATELGDPVEIEALRTVFKSSPGQSIPIGSVKSNVGHLDTAAGITGFIKTVLALKKKQIPPSINFEKPNTKIDFENSPFYVNNRLSGWEERSGIPLRAGVSSFGQGGTNVHVVLEEAPASPGLKKQPDEPGKAGRKHLLLLSARTPTALETKTRELASYMAENSRSRLADIVYTLQTGRKDMRCRRMLLCAAGEEAAGLLAAEKKSKKVKTVYAKKDETTVIFLLSGQGSQYVDMGKGLYENVPAFRSELDRCFEILKALTDVDFKSILYPSPREQAPGQPGAAQVIDQTEITQPIVFIFVYSLARLLLSWGVKPRAMIGYSMGEYAAACLAGVFSLEDALKLIIRRGQAMQKTAPASMLSVPLSEVELTPLLKDHPEVSLAISNGPSSVVTGPVAAVRNFEKQAREKRLLCANINMGHAVHTPMMDPIRREFEESMQDIGFNAPGIPYISNVTGKWISAAAAADPTYWGEHLCSTVRFSEGAGELLKEENAVFIEVGPGRLLGNILRQHPGRAPSQTIFNIIKHQQERVEDDDYFLNKIGEMWLHGVSIDWEAVHAGERLRRVPLPTYPFERQRCWVEEEPFHTRPGMKGAVGPGAVFDAAGKEAPGNESGPGQGSQKNVAVPGEQENEIFTHDNIDYEAPRDELEQDIAQLWQDFLGFERIGIHTDFFEINGDSLTATQLITRLQQMYPVEISLQQFFEKPTIANLADIVRELLIEKVKGLSEEELEKLAGE